MSIYATKERTKCCLVRKVSLISPLFHVVMKMCLPGTTAPAGNSISLFSLSKDGAPCILLQVDALIEFRYKTKFGKYGVSLLLHVIPYELLVVI